MSPTIPHESTDRATELPHIDLQTDREFLALLHSAGTAPLSETGWLKVTGSDRVRWLNGMVTNSIGDLSPGAGCYNLFLNAQGRIQGDAYVFAEPDHLLIQTGLAQLPGLTALLDRYIIMDDVELTDVTSRLHGLLLAGPHAPEILRQLDLSTPAEDVPSLVHISGRSTPVVVIRAYSTLVPRFEIWCHTASPDGSEQNATLADLSAKLAAAGAVSVTPAALNLLRIAEGTPLFGVDIRDRDLPQETGATRALHFAKGCYLGQEIVERIRSRGNVHRTFGGFLLEGAFAAPGLALSSDEKQIGELTSVGVIPLASGQAHATLGLGYIRREALALGKPIHFPGGTAHPVPLPFDKAKIL